MGPLNTSNPQNTNGRSSLEEAALQYLQEKGVTSVPDLHMALWAARPTVTRAETTDLLSGLAEQGKVELDYLPETSFVEFLKHWERNLEVYAAIAVTFVSILAIFALPAVLPFAILRWILGSVFVLFIPGYMATGALFPRIGELNSLERFALSIGLSLALVMFVGLLLNYTPWGISLFPIAVSLTIISTALGTVRLARQYKCI